MNDTRKIYELYGDQIIIGVITDLYDLATKSEEEQKAAAVDFANKFCLPSKPSFLNHSASSINNINCCSGLYVKIRCCLALSFGKILLNSLYFFIIQVIDKYETE